MIAEVGQEPRLNVCFSILLDRRVLPLHRHESWTHKISLVGFSGGTDYY